MILTTILISTTIPQSKFCLTVARARARAVIALSKHCIYNNLHFLDFSNNDIRDKGAIALSDCLQHYENLHTLNIGGNHFRDEGATALSNSFHIGNQGAIALSDGLKHCNNTIASFSYSSWTTNLKYTVLCTCTVAK